MNGHRIHEHDLPTLERSGAITAADVNAVLNPDIDGHTIQLTNPRELTVYELVTTSSIWGEDEEPGVQSHGYFSSYLDPEGDTDTWEFAGKLAGLTIFGECDVFADGKPVTPAGPEPEPESEPTPPANTPHTISITSTGENKVAVYQFR